ncbi:MAG TPA: PhzF family phenazine biosynthesis isomerase [Steroidobacteraceae bacterium]|jgi:PhzF family phenazine biosynthesis protein|nr:PhzF family phenazine biosynthesis isomerase [Steroidobacteraceae bacterium]
MSRSYRAFQVDAFTRTLFNGNPAGVVLDADDLSDDEMQKLARELGRGDTAFISRATGDDHDLRMRFFTSKCEVPFVGHATVAAHFVRSTLGVLPAKPLRQLSGTGIVTIDVAPRDGATEVGMRLSPPRSTRELQPAELDAVLDALGVSHGDLDARCPAEIFVTGSTRMMLGLRTAHSLSVLHPNLEALARLTPHLGAEGYFVFALNLESAQAQTEARMFCPAIGVPEDAVSGNAHGMLGAFLVRHGLLATHEGIARFRGSQGRALGRPGEVRVEVQEYGGEAYSVRVAGNAVIVFETRIALPSRD